MTTLRHSPPRSKKESCDANEAPTPAVESEPDTSPEVPEDGSADIEAAEAGPDPQTLKAAARQERQAAKEAAKQQRAAEAETKQQAKHHARLERRQSRDQEARAKVEARLAAANAKAAARVDTETAQQQAPELVTPAVATQPARPAKVQRAVKDDHIVEPPREPKLDRADRRRRAKEERAQAKQEARITAGERDGKSSTRGGKRLGLFLAGLLGAVGLICSVILALGALLVALGATDGNSLYDFTSSICDVLVGPLRDVFSFSGTNAEMKESLVAWGAGSIGYLLVGILVQSFLRARFEDN